MNNNNNTPPKPLEESLDLKEFIALLKPFSQKKEILLL